MSKNTSVSPTPTLAELIAKVQTQPNISETKRQLQVRALRFYGQIEGRVAPETIRVDAKISVTKMAHASHQALGVSSAYLRNTRSIFRTALREHGILAPARPKNGPIANAAWLELASLASASHRPHRLLAFFSWCDAQGILPEAVTSAHLENHLDELVASKGGKNIRAGVSELARLWNRYSDENEAWPRTRLALKPIALPRAPTLESYPQALQADIARFLEGASPRPVGKLFSGLSRDEQGVTTVRPILSPKTIEARRKGVRLLLWGATATGTPQDEITSLDFLILPDVAQRLLEWHYTRLGKDTPTAGLAGLLDTLTAVAAYKNLTGQQQRALRTLTRVARPKRQTEMSDDNARLMNLLEQRDARRLLLQCPFKLMAEARRMRDGWTDKQCLHHSPAPMRAAWLAAIAVAIEIELHLPIRVLDLASLDMGHNLTLLDKGRPAERWHLGLQARKNGMRVETELSHESAGLLREYVDAFRPIGPHPETCWLFPHRDMADRPRPEGHFSEAISDQILQHTGIAMNTHAFRAFAALLIVERDPHALEDVRAILGHKSFDTAWRFYLRQNRIAAGARLGKTIRDARHDLSGAR